MHILHHLTSFALQPQFHFTIATNMIWFDSHYIWFWQIAKSITYNQYKHSIWWQIILGNICWKLCCFLLSSLAPPLELVGVVFVPSSAAPAPPRCWNGKGCCPSASLPRRLARRRAWFAMYPCATSFSVMAHGCFFAHMHFWHLPLCI